MFAKMGRGQVEHETLAKVGHFVDSLQVGACMVLNVEDQNTKKVGWW